jgi:hypothetical protein
MELAELLGVAWTTGLPAPSIIPIPRCSLAGRRR